MKVNIENFLNIIDENENKKVKIISIDVANIGEMEFIRPKESIILEYLSGVSKAIERKELNKNEERIGLEYINLEKLVEVSSKFIYHCSAIFKSKEVRARYKELDPYMIPFEVLGATTTLEIAEKLSSKFENGYREKVDEAIKN